MEEKAPGARPQADSAGALTSRLSLVRRLSGLPALLLAASVVAVLYNAYRYPLRINDSSTSPTYRSTPQSLQAGKYAILAVLAAVLLGLAVRHRRELNRLRRSDVLLLVLGSYVLLRSGLATASTHSTSSLRVVLPFVSGIPFAVAASSWILGKAGRSVAFVQTAVTFGATVVMLDAAVNLLELALWATTGRLPALAYSHGLVRFGGIWDDPNGTATFSAFVTTAVLGGALGARRRPSLVVLLAAVFNLVVAWSFSGWLVFLIGVVGVGVPRVGWRKVAAGLGALATAIAAVVGLAALTGTNVGSAASTKLSSARERLGIDRHFVHAHDLTSWIVGSSHPRQLEDAFGTWLSTTGVIGLLLLVAWLVVALRSIGGERRLWLLVGASGLLVASFLVPLFLVFPIGFFLVLVLATGAEPPPSPGEPVPG